MVENKISSTTLTKRDSYRCALGWNDTKSTRRVLGHSLFRLLVRSHHSLIRLLRTGCFARALRCAHSLAALCSFARSAALIRSLRCAHSLAPLCSFACSAALICLLVLLLHPWRFHSNIHNVESVLYGQVYEEKKVFKLFFFCFLHLWRFH